MYMFVPITYCWVCGETHDGFECHPTLTMANESLTPVRGRADKEGCCNNEIEPSRIGIVVLPEKSPMGMRGILQQGETLT